MRGRLLLHKGKHRCAAGMGPFLECQIYQQDVFHKGNITMAGNICQLVITVLLQLRC